MQDRPFIDAETLQPVIAWPEHLDALVERGIDAAEVEETKRSLIAVGKAMLNSTQQNRGALYAGEALGTILHHVMRDTAELYTKAGDIGYSDVPKIKGYLDKKPLADVRADEALKAVTNALNTAYEEALQNATQSPQAPDSAWAASMGKSPRSPVGIVKKGDGQANINSGTLG